MDNEASLRVTRQITSLKKQVVDTIREAIFDGRFAPGDRLVERQLCDMLDVSRTSIREALSQLTAEGLVQSIPHRGPIVAVYSAEDARAIYELRANLEEMTGRLFVKRATPEEIKKVERAFQELKRSYRGKSDSDRLHVKSNFYAALTSGAHNPMLEEMLRMIHGRVSMLRATTLSQPGRLAASVAELEKIMQAIRGGDTEAAGNACRIHVENAGAVAQAVLSRHDEAQWKSVSPQVSKKRLA